MTKIPIGKTKAASKENYSNKSLFFEYNTTTKNLRIGIRLDYFVILEGALYTVFYNNW
jgi:hypothetical protein